ncbi:MAG TPA: hypothetical protein PK188_01440 [Thermosynergistes sp.]|nr:hypothetical protein [Thermosynergistes sp.]
MRFSKDSLEDIALFGRVIATALLVGGYIFLGLFIGKHIHDRGGPPWLPQVGASIGAIFGLWQSWVFLKTLIKKWRSK